MNLVAVTARGRIMIPVNLRKKFHLKKGSQLCIEEVEGEAMILRPLAGDPVEKTRGILRGKKSLLESLVEDRQKEAARG